MANYLEHLDFLVGHWPGAAGAAAAFLLGAVAARLVVAYDLRFFMATPLWFLRHVAAFLKRNPSVLGLAAFIFAFNGTAMFVYMLFGLIPYMPAVIAFLTGMNVAVAALKSGEFMGDVPLGLEAGETANDAVPDGEGPDDPADAPPPAAVEPNPLAILASVLVLALELPCFWFAISMGAGMAREGYWLGTLFQADHLADFRMRALTYVLVILPVLAVSALAEGYAVKRPTRAPRQ